jgi:hypothetical protein
MLAFYAARIGMVAPHNAAHEFPNRKAEPFSSSI